MPALDSSTYWYLCDPAMLRQTVGDFRGPEPETGLEDHLLPAFSGERGRVLVRADVWNTPKGPARSLRSVQWLAEPGPGWMAFPLAELGSKKLRNVLWWSTIKQPLSFLLEAEPPSKAWAWLARTWPKVDDEKKRILHPDYLEPEEYLADPIGRILADRPSWGPRRPIAGFFDEGLLALVSGAD